jgi:hypothetical protein
MKLPKISKELDMAFELPGKNRMLDVDEVNVQLTPRFAALKQEMLHLHAPADVEARLLTAFAAQQAMQHKQLKPFANWRKWFAEPWQWSGVLAMGLLVVLMLVNKPLLIDAGGALGMNEVAVVATDELYEDIPFIALESGEVILKQDNMRIVRADIPHTMLASLGLPVNPQVAGESAKAEMLVGDNDEYLALRFIPSE